MMRDVALALCLLLGSWISDALPHGEITATGCQAYTHECVPYYQCLNGEINTDGAHLIDIRTPVRTTLLKDCTNPEDSTVPGLCCRNPGATPPTTVVTPTPFPIATTSGVRNYGLDLRTQVKLGKNEAHFGEFPWQAALFFSNYTFKCGASLIEDRWLITGAHCVNGYQYSDFKVRLGEWQVDRYDEPLKHIEVDIASITQHPQFNPTNLHNDVAVIELRAPVPLQHHINTVCLPNSGQFPLPGTRCFATGWGKYDFEGNSQATLKNYDVPFVEHGYCQDLLRKTRLGRFFKLDQSLMCAGGEVNIDACSGFGGGPLVCEDLDSGLYFLQGIAAWSINCGSTDVPNVYADVRYFRDWIGNALQQSSVGTGCQVSTHQCVPHYQCINGEINTDGAGLIDVRTPVRTTSIAECSSPDHLCCRIPGATPPSTTTLGPIIPDAYTRTSRV